jgi:hypothetical protein
MVKIICALPVHLTLIRPLFASVFTTVSVAEVRWCRWWVTNVSIQHWWNCWKEKPKYSWVNLSRLHLVPHKFHIVGSGFAPCPPRLKKKCRLKTFRCNMQGGTDTIQAVYDPSYSLLLFLITGPCNSVNSISDLYCLSMSHMNLVSPVITLHRVRKRLYPFFIFLF